jgi:hypothetical protein
LLNLAGPAARSAFLAAAVAAAPALRADVRRQVVAIRLGVRYGHLPFLPTETTGRRATVTARTLERDLDAGNPEPTARSVPHTGQWCMP